MTPQELGAAFEEVMRLVFNLEDDKAAFQTPSMFLYQYFIRKSSDLTLWSLQRKCLRTH